MRKLTGVRILDIIIVIGCVGVLISIIYPSKRKGECTMQRAVGRLIVSIAIELEEPDEDDLVKDEDGVEIDPVAEMYDIPCADTSYVDLSDMTWPIESEEAFRVQILKMHRKENAQ